MLKKLFMFTGVVFLVLPIFSASAMSGGKDIASCVDEVCYNQKGLNYYRKGFYEFAPKNQVKEAEQNYELAVAEFQKAIGINPDYEDAHRNLARVFYVQKRFEEAAREYRKIIQLNPQDIDSYVTLASILAKEKRYEEAAEELNNAKRQTTDARVIEKLNGYISKIQERK